MRSNQMLSPLEHRRASNRSEVTHRHARIAPRPDSYRSAIAPREAATATSGARTGLTGFPTDKPTSPHGSHCAHRPPPIGSCLDRRGPELGRLTPRTLHTWSPHPSWYVSTSITHRTRTRRPDSPRLPLTSIYSRLRNAQSSRASADASTIRAHSPDRAPDAFVSTTAPCARFSPIIPAPIAHSAGHFSDSAPFRATSH
jgi:hypothetical protein